MYVFGIIIQYYWTWLTLKKLKTANLLYTNILAIVYHSLLLNLLIYFYRFSKQSVLKWLGKQIVERKKGNWYHYDTVSDIAFIFQNLLEKINDKSEMVCGPSSVENFASKKVSQMLEKVNELEHCKILKYPQFIVEL